MGTFWRLSPPVAAVVSALALAGCNTSGWFGGGSTQPDPVAQPAAVPDMPATIRSSEIVGRWGYAAFHRQEDRARTEANARGQCRQAVVISQGPGGGVMMYLADQPELQELRLKGVPTTATSSARPTSLPADRRTVRSSASTAASCCSSSPIRRSTAATAPASTCAVRRRQAVWRRPRRRNNGRGPAQRQILQLESPPQSPRDRMPC